MENRARISCSVAFDLALAGVLHQQICQDAASHTEYGPSDEKDLVLAHDPGCYNPRIIPSVVVMLKCLLLEIYHQAEAGTVYGAMPCLKVKTIRFGLQTNVSKSQHDILLSIVVARSLFMTRR